MNEQPQEEESKKQVNIENAPVKLLFESKDIQKKFHDMLGKKASGFMVSVINVVSNNALLAKADRSSIIFAAATAAALDLPIEPNLGFAYIVPYAGKAQFQIGYKGLKQLSIRSGEFKTMNASDVREGELKSNNRLTGKIDFEWIEDEVVREATPIVGYVAYFELRNGFSKTSYMPIEKIEKHAKKYSQTYKKNFGNWKDDFDSMALKTVMKLLLSKDAPLSIEMQTAIKNDQATGENDYSDNKKLTAEEVSQQKEEERVKQWINDSKSVEQLEEMEEYVSDLPEDHEIKNLFNLKLKELQNES